MLKITLKRAVIIILGTGVCSILLFIDVASKRDLTISNIIVSQQIIHDYYNMNNRIPSSLAEVNDHRDFIYDGWGNQLYYKYDELTVTLTSYGKDKKKGGSGDDSDIIVIFKLTDNVEMWLKKAE